MGAQGEPTGEGERADEAMLVRRRQAQRLIQLHQFCNILISLTVAPTRIHLLKQLSPQSGVAALSAQLTAWTTINGVCEFVLNPTLGRLCDAYGRRPCFMISPLASVVLKTLFVLRPSASLLGAEAIICDGTRVISGATVCSASLSDLLSGGDLAAAFTTQLAVSGVAVMAGPVIGSSLISRTGSLYAPFAASAVMAGGMLATDYLLIHETLDSGKRRQFTGFANPLSLVNLFSSGSGPLTTLVCICGLNYAVEPKNVSLLNQFHRMATLGMSQAAMGWMTSLTGLGMLVQSPISRACARAGMGPLAIRSLANLFTGVSFGLLASVKTVWAAWLASVCQFVGEARGMTNKALATDLAVKAGMGRGEFSGQLANLRALVGVVATVIYGRCYSASLRRGQPSLSFLAPLLSAAATEVLCRRHAGGAPR